MIQWHTGRKFGLNHFPSCCPGLNLTLNFLMFVLAFYVLSKVNFSIMLTIMFNYRNKRRKSFFHFEKAVTNLKSDG